MLQNAVIRNVAININRGMLLVDNSVLKMYLLNSQLSLKIKSLTFTFISFFDIQTDKINQQPEKCENRNDPDFVEAFQKKWWVESDFKAPNLPLSLRFKGSGCRGMLLVDNSVLKMYLLNSQLSLKIKSLTFTFISFFDIPGKTICWKYVTAFQTDMGVSV
jgi:hypothetical protein